MVGTVLESEEGASKMSQEFPTILGEPQPALIWCSEHHVRSQKAEICQKGVKVGTTVGSGNTALFFTRGPHL